MKWKCFFLFSLTAIILDRVIMISFTFINEYFVYNQDLIFKTQTSINSITAAVEETQKILIIGILHFVKNLHISINHKAKKHIF